MGAPVGNQNASKQWKKSLEKALARLGGSDVESGLAIIADKVVTSAACGDKDAWKDIADRLDGKPSQSVELIADVTNRASSMTDEQLAEIASAGNRS